MVANPPYCQNRRRPRRPGRSSLALLLMVITIVALAGQADAVMIYVNTQIGGTIEPCCAIDVPAGTDQTFTITPMTGPGSRYRIRDVLVDGVSQGAVPTYTFYAVAVEHIIEAFFDPDPYIIHASAGAHGAIVPSGDVAVEGPDQYFGIVPDLGYHVLELLVDGSQVPPATEYMFSNVASEHWISVTFAADNFFTIEASASTGGTINPGGSITVAPGDSAVFDISPNAGYITADVMVDSVSQGPLTKYVFRNVSAVHTIRALFNPLPIKPHIASIPVTQGIARKQYVYQLDISGIPDPTLTLPVAPAGMTIGQFTPSETRPPARALMPPTAITWIPTDAQVGDFPVTLVAENIQGADTQSFVVTVYPGSCCHGMTGNIDCDASDGCDISDLSTLIDFLYINFTPLCCEGEANTDGEPGIDISDLSALIDFLYISFTPLADCTL